ncbi:hypothetical protein WUBG_16730 [Wuchereria bancrofti]|uniref:Uncharacterized protein n=1 Tax=Wuchereria bancrofti TaxID=6293 RepID=J9EAE8_WUCBA|nr:hypothetical protein WUBG_16730 [Wuchereria bancrofti]
MFFNITAGDSCKNQIAKNFKSLFQILAFFSWIHFEGRNFENLITMIKYVLVSRQSNEKPKLSLECEKVRDFETLENAIPLVDVVFVSKDFARSNIRRLIKLAQSALDEFRIVGSE